MKEKEYLRAHVRDYCDKKKKVDDACNQFHLYCDESQVFRQDLMELKNMTSFCQKYEQDKTNYNHLLWCLNAGLGIKSEL